MDGLGAKQGMAERLFANNYGLPRGILTKFRDLPPDWRIFDRFGVFTGFGIGNHPCKPLVFGQQNTEKRIERD
jgi:hypothetical protein